MSETTASSHSSVRNEMPPDSSSSVEPNGASSRSSQSLESSSDNDLSQDITMDDASFFSDLSSEISLDDLLACSSSNPWIWVIEYLAKFKTDAAVLHDVFEMAPELPDDLGKSANEMVAFRCLAYLFDSNEGQTGEIPSADTVFKVDFDLSESCEDVLQCILEETPLSDLKPGAPELSKWNVRPFIMHKRECLPKCTLEKLRVAIVEGTDPFFTSLRTSGGFFGMNQQERTSIENKEPNEHATGHSSQDVSERLILERNTIPPASNTTEIHCNKVPAKDKDDTGHPKERISKEIQGCKENNHVCNLESSKETAGSLTKRAVCLKCQRDGRLLVCVRTGCSIAVHKNCLRSQPYYNAKGSFHCPQCVYTETTSEYLESKNEIATARGKVAKFLNLLNSRCNPEEFIKRFGDQDLNTGPNQEWGESDHQKMK